MTAKSPHLSVTSLWTGFGLLGIEMAHKLLRVKETINLRMILYIIRVP
jgi:hypothetical protein